MVSPGWIPHGLDFLRVFVYQDLEGCSIALHLRLYVKINVLFEPEGESDFLLA